MPNHPADQKAVDFFGSFRLAVPSQWQCHLEENGCYSCYEEHVESGTLWVTYFAWRFPGRLTEEQLPDIMHNSLIPALITSNIDNPLSSEITTFSGGDILNEVLYHEQDLNDGIELRSRRWHYIRPFPDRVLIISATLVLPNDLADKPEFLNLTDVMRDNISSMQIQHTDILFENMTQSFG